MNIGLFSPYLHILGGGEKYFLTIASLLSSKHQVFIYGDESVRQKAQENFNIPLDKISFQKPAMLQNRIKKYMHLAKHDVFIFMTDGSLLLSPAKKNFLIIQSPAHIPPISMMNRFKSVFWKPVCYSQFMKQIIKDRLKRDAVILSPCIDTSLYINKLKKEKIILSVGRFFPYPHNKKHDILIKTFRENENNYFKGYKLIIAGAVTETGGYKILEQLKLSAKGHRIEILINLPFKQLVSLYNQAKIYWHATGFGEDLVNNPQKAEHFGLTTLEAMASSAVPVVFKGGGQEDIVVEGKSGYFWETPSELIEKTSKLALNEHLCAAMSKEALARAQDFDCRNLYEKIEKIIAG